MSEVGFDETDYRAALSVVAHFARTVAVVSPSVLALREKLEYGLIASRRGHQIDCGKASLEDVEFIGTRLAAQALGWSERRVRRHQADLGGQLVGDRLVFDARMIRRYADDREADDARNS